MNRKLLVVIAIVALLCTTALYALSYVSAIGTVHSKATAVITETHACGNPPTTCTSTTVVQTLKIERFDGSKVSGDCLASDAIRHECDIASPGDPAEGLVECNSGWCSWIELDVTLVGG